MYTAGLWVTWFCSMSFVYNVNEKNINSWLGPLTMWSLYFLPVPVWVFFRDFSFFPNPKAMHIGRIGVSKWSPSECRCVECALPWDGVLSRVVPSWHPQLPGEVPPTHNPELQLVGKWCSHSFFFIFLKRMYSSHLLWCLILEVLFQFYCSKCSK